MANDDKDKAPEQVEITKEMVDEVQFHVNMIARACNKHGPPFEVALQFCARKALELMTNCKCEACETFLSGWEQMIEHLTVPSEMPRGAAAAARVSNLERIIAEMMKGSKLDPS